jgi:hypothetical protein
LGKDQNYNTGVTVMGRLAGVLCDHKTHGCIDNSFAWAHPVHKFIFLENPKACSTYVKVELVKQNVEGISLGSRNQITQYPGFKVFGIYRDPKDKMFSVFRDFIKSNKEMRLDQMRSLFNRDSCELSFSEFLDLALVHKDHHWSPNFPYLFLPDVDVVLFNYHASVMEEIEDFLGLEVNKPRTNPSLPYDHVITPEESEKIYQIMKIDYDNMNYFQERIINV